jgi:CHASE2 domain-containing sensor protein
MPTAPPSPRPRLSPRRGIAIALLAWAVVALLEVAGAFAASDLKLLDWRFQLRGPRPVSDLVALVEVDDATINSYGGAWPLSRLLTAALITGLGEGGARAVGFDLLFLNPVPHDSLSDEQLVYATAGERGIVHAIAFPPLPSANAPSPADSALLLRHGVARDDLPVAPAGQVKTPFPALLAAARHLGHVSVAVDRDGVVRRAPLFMRYEDRLYPALALSMVQVGLEKGEAPALARKSGGLQLTWRSGRTLFVPVDHEGATSIDFVGPRDAFPRIYSMAQVLEWFRTDRVDSLRDAFHQRLVLVGATSMEHVATDLGTTPYEATTPLVFLHANFLDALVQERLLHRVPGIVRLLVLGLLAIGLGYLAVTLTPLAAFAVAAGSTLAVAAAGFGLFLQGIDAPPTAGLILPAIVYSAVQSYRVVFVEQKDRARARELAIAARIQKGLLPAARPTHPALDVFGTNVPAQEVGGDYYDWVPLHGAGLAVVVGDVEGKGIGAALLMVHLHASFHAEVRTQGTPREVVEEMHRSLFAATEARQFATLFLATVDRDGRHLRYCSAGHNPALHAGRDGVRWLEATGLPLGMILDGPPYEERGVELAPGDVLVLYSDGITEYEHRGEMYGEARLASVVQGLAATGESASAIGQSILEDVRAFARNGAASDDVTLVVIRRLGTAPDAASAEGRA